MRTQLFFVLCFVFVVNAITIPFYDELLNAIYKSGNYSKESVTEVVSRAKNALLQFFPPNAIDVSKFCQITNRINFLKRKPIESLITHA